MRAAKLPRLGTWRNANDWRTTCTVLCLAVGRAASAVSAAWLITTESPLDCSGGGRLCTTQVQDERTPEEKMALIDDRAKAHNFPPPGALRSAFEAKQALQPGNPNMLFASTFDRHVWTYEFPAEARLSVDPLEQARQSRALGSAKGGALGFAGLAVLMLSGLRRRLRR